MRKYIALGLALVCVLGLVGCGKQQNISEENKNRLIYGELPEPSDADVVYGEGEPLDIEGISQAKAEETILETRSTYTYEELSEMPAGELLDLFIRNGLVINDDLKASYTEEELQVLFKGLFDMWHTGLSALSSTMYIDLAEQTKVIYDKIAE